MPQASMPSPRPQPSMQFPALPPSIQMPMPQASMPPPGPQPSMQFPTLPPSIQMPRPQASMPPPRPQPSIVQTEPHVELPVFGPHTFEKAVENAKAYLDKWPLIPEPEKGVLLQDGVNRMEKTLRSKRLAPIGWQDKNWHRQVLEMCNRQLRQLKYGHYFGRTDTKRREIALSIAGSYNRGWKAATRILNHERQWILEGTIPLSKQGKHAKTLCMLEDPSTRDAMMEYIHGAGRNACSLGLAKAVTAYWKASELPELQERHLAECTANEWFKRCGYKWSDIRKGVCVQGRPRTRRCRQIPQGGFLTSYG
jgi:hypothetical protein